MPAMPHLPFALFDDPGEIVVARLDYLRVPETARFGTLAGRRIAFPVSAVACRAFRFVSCSALVVRPDPGAEQKRSGNNNRETDYSRHRFGFHRVSSS
jgi:hypothetical protein